LRRLYKAAVISAEIIALMRKHVCNCARSGNYEVFVAGRRVAGNHEITVAFLGQVSIVNIFLEELA